MSLRNKYKYPILIFIIVVSLLGSKTANAQLTNDQCNFAKNLPAVDNYCSEDGEFSNINASADPAFANGCISVHWSNGVWFSFIPREPAVLIRVFGTGQGGTIRFPKILLFESCNSFLECSPGKDIGNDELVVSDLNIGQLYFIMVESEIGGEGNFKLCVDDFIPPPNPESDCKDAVVLCDKSPFRVESLIGVGMQTNEIEATNCIGQEFASSWYKWTCDVPGTLSFTLTPNNHRGRNFISDDIDFAVYELPNGLDDCSNKVLLRCMASGANGNGSGGNQPLANWIECNGPTGLMIGDPDITESPGCQPGNNNFVKELDMIAGKSYVLIINNFSRSSQGFSIEFGGTGTFLGPKPDFSINSLLAFECDKTVEFTNESISETDPIINYTWNFGDRAVPNRGTGVGPFDVLYQSFGDKIAALTVETSRGCKVTKILDFYVDPCCKDTSTLDILANPTDLRCFNIPEGAILAIGLSGSPEYLFNINNGPYQPNPLFTDLSAGTYDLSLYDIKGCRDTIYQVIINQPPPIIVDAGPDQELDLGFTTFMSGFFESFNGVDSIYWSPSDDFLQNGITNPEVFPKNTTTYTFTIIDENGCIQEDMVTIRVNKKYDVYSPNIFTPGNKDNNNDYFNIWSNRALKYVELLEVYDRWGNLVYQGVDVNASPDGTLIVGDHSKGWDGTFKNLQVNPGVFAWRARVRFIDDEVKEFSGDLTVLR